MYASGGCDFVSNTKENSRDNETLPEDARGIFSHVARIRCLCGVPVFSEPMVECEDPWCRTLQHTCCVLIPEGPAMVIPSVPPQFYCEICRVNRADPFWVTVAQPLCPVKLSASDTTSNGENRITNVTNSFHLARAETNLLQNTEYDVQVWCILLNDKVPFRIHWPLYASLEINGFGIQTHNRSNSHQLGPNGRDDGPSVKACMREGANTISFSVCDPRTFSFGVRVVKRRTLKQIIDLITNQQEGDKWEDSLARVSRCIGGGSAVESADGDLEFVTDSITVNIRCPMSGSRIRIAGRFKPCTHMGCFDLETFVELTQRTRKWQCPICLKNYCLENICTDSYFSCIASKLQCCEDDVTEVEIKQDGCWRVKDETKCTMDLAQWHYPDGTIHMELESGTRLESAAHFDNDVRLPDNPSASSAGSEMIILSDSEDENEKLIASGAVCQIGQAPVDKTFLNVPDIGGRESRLADSTYFGTTNHPYSNSNDNYNSNNFESLYSALASSSSVSSQFLITGPNAKPHEISSIAYPSTLNDHFLTPCLNMMSSRQMSGIVQGSVSNTSYTQACTTLNDYGVDAHLRNIEHSNLNSQLGESNFDTCGQWSSFSVGSNLYHDVTGGISAENGLNLGNQASGVEAAMGFPMIAGLGSSLKDNTTANSEGIDNTLYFSDQREKMPVHSYCSENSKRPCFIHTAPDGYSVDSTKMMQPINRSAANLGHGLPTGWTGQQTEGGTNNASIYYGMPTNQGNQFPFLEASFCNRTGPI